MNGKPKIGFLIYDSRSGSTLLASLLDEHPDVGVSFEADFLISAMEHHQKTGFFPEDQILYEMLKADKRLSEWGIDISQVYQECTLLYQKATVKNFLETVFNHLKRHDTSKKNAYLFIIKQGLLTGYLESLSSLYPDAYIIHIYRDGRAVYASKKKNKNIDSNLPMSNDPVKSARRWMKIQNKISAMAKVMNICEIRYEDLIINREKQLELIWEYLNLDSSRSPPKNSDFSYAKNLPKNQKQIHPLVGKPLDQSRISAWQSTLSLIEIWKYERVVHRALKARQYMPVFYSISGMFRYMKYKKQIFKKNT